ncbi:MAG: type IV pilus modification protein PilV, partial [Rhodocyclaceae bacterium]|nr:type IV pilus modification protein PilV [Rhodocyclaceae bacterium]
MFLKSRGFSLIEVLVTLIILMFGLLGLGALIIKGQQMGFEAYQRHIALNLVHDIAERMQANLYASYPTN